MNSHVYIHDITILAPLDSPNTDGVDPGEDKDTLFLKILLMPQF